MKTSSTYPAPAATKLWGGPLGHDLFPRSALCRRLSLFFQRFLRLGRLLGLLGLLRPDSPFYRILWKFCKRLVRDAVFEQLLNRQQQRMLFGADRRQGHPDLSCPAGATDPMYIIFRNLGEIVIHYVR